MGDVACSERCLSSLPCLERWLAPDRNIRSLTEHQNHADFGSLLSSPFLPPKLDLRLICVPEAYVLFGAGRDGMVFDRHGAPLRETMGFVDAAASLPEPAWLSANSIPLDFVGFASVDPAWTNYYHWLCLAVARMRIASEILAPEVRMLLPDFRAPAPGAISAADVATRLASLEMMALESRTAFLRPGVYRMPEVYLLTISHEQHALLSCFEHFRNAYSPALRSLSHDPQLPRRVFVKRRHNTRIDALNGSILDRVLLDAGFHATYLEDLTFREQASLFHNAECVVSAHGAGLSNLVFGRPQLRVLELHDWIGGESYLRPWFYFISRAFGQDYSYINLSRAQPKMAYWSAVIGNFAA